MIRKACVFGLGLFVSLWCPARGAQAVLDQVFSNFSFTEPVDFQTVPDSSNRVMIVTQTGQIYAVKNTSAPTRALLLDLKDSITVVSSELGMLGLACHPRFRENGYFYLDYTAPNPLRTVVVRYTMHSPSSDSVDLSSRLVLLQIPQPFENHNGGCLAFGPDGNLYIAMGDGGSSGDPYHNAQNKAALLGKILRINVDSASGGKNYSIPIDNPFKGAGDGSAEEIYAYGLRNPWRFSFDPQTKKLWAGDVGQNLYEEIDTIEKGKNYGWPTLEGFHCYNAPGGCSTTGLTPPILEYSDTVPEGGVCVIGGYVYRGTAVPPLFGKYIYADAYSRHVWALTVDSLGAVHNEYLFDAAGLVTSFGLDEHQELYLTIREGKIYRFDRSTTGAEVEPHVPTAFRLDQNYPNPFNGETVIPFHLAAASHVILVIYDELGRMVTTLADAEYQPGSYTIRWTPAGLASGVYTCRLTAGAVSASRQLVLQK